jgi:hypothetical protein
VWQRLPRFLVHIEGDEVSEKVIRELPNMSIRAWRNYTNSPRRFALVGLQNGDKAPLPCSFHCI